MYVNGGITKIMCWLWRHVEQSCAVCTWTVVSQASSQCTEGSRTIDADDHGYIPNFANRFLFGRKSPLSFHIGQKWRVSGSIWLKIIWNKGKENKRTSAVCCRHLPTTTICIILRCRMFLYQKTDRFKSSSSTKKSNSILVLFSYDPLQDWG